MTEFIRPFTKCVTVLSGVNNVVNFLDASGNTLLCNYIKIDNLVTPPSGTLSSQDSSFFVLLSSIPGITTLSSLQASSISSVDALTGVGFCGFFGIGLGGEEAPEIRLPPKDAVSRITIILNSRTINNVRMAITYGVTQGVNELRFNNMPKGV